jgi:hypothetical protein
MNNQSSSADFIQASRILKVSSPLGKTSGGLFVLLNKGSETDCFRR